MFSIPYLTGRVDAVTFGPLLLLTVRAAVAPMVRIARISAYLLFCATYLCAATSLLLIAQSVPPTGAGILAFSPSVPAAKTPVKSFWLQRRHLAQRAPALSADGECILVFHPERADKIVASLFQRHSSADYTSFASSRLANRAPPLS